MRAKVKQKNGSSRICGKRRIYGNQTILVWHASASKRRHIRDMGPELEALVTFIAPHKSAMNQKNKQAFAIFFSCLSASFGKDLIIT